MADPPAWQKHLQSVLPQEQTGDPATDAVAPAPGGFSTRQKVVGGTVGGLGGLLMLRKMGASPKKMVNAMRGWRNSPASAGGPVTGGTAPGGVVQEALPGLGSSTTRSPRFSGIRGLTENLGGGARSVGKGVAGGLATVGLGVAASEIDDTDFMRRLRGDPTKGQAHGDETVQALIKARAGKDDQGVTPSDFLDTAMDVFGSADISSPDARAAEQMVKEGLLKRIEIPGTKQIAGTGMKGSYGNYELTKKGKQAAVKGGVGKVGAQAIADDAKRTREDLAGHLQSMGYRDSQQFLDAYDAVAERLAGDKKLSAYEKRGQMAEMSTAFRQQAEGEIVADTRDKWLAAQAQAGVADAYGAHYGRFADDAVRQGDEQAQLLMTYANQADAEGQPATIGNYWRSQALAAMSNSRNQAADYAGRMQSTPMQNAYQDQIKTFNSNVRQLINQSRSGGGGDADVTGFENELGVSGGGGVGAPTGATGLDPAVEQAIQAIIESQGGVGSGLEDYNQWASYQPS